LLHIPYLYSMQVFYQPQAPQVLELPEEESRHCVKVLRHSACDTIWVTNGRNQLFECRLTEANARSCSFTILSEKAQPSRPYKVHLAIAPTKNADRLEWMLEKCVELGLDELSLLQCQHSERIRINGERLLKKAVSAMKQSLNLQVPHISEPIPFAAFIQAPERRQEQLLIAYVDEQPRPHLLQAAQKGQSVCILIGPEGDFSKAEIEGALAQGFAPVSLGPSRLRTETAGLAACHILNLVNQF
jgi:16S rRNA (uracil1498-N3)-methyltransferase